MLQTGQEPVCLNQVHLFGLILELIRYDFTLSSDNSAASSLFQLLLY